MPSSDNPTRALPTLYEFFAPEGILARSSLPYEYRTGQLEMAKAVERALAERRHLIVEAGTGTGKTLAYLLPALRTGQRVIVSTGTKDLKPTAVDAKKAIKVATPVLVPTKTK